MRMKKEIFSNQADILKRARFEMKLNQRQVGKLIGASTTKVHRLESGKIEIGIEHAIAYEKHLGVNVYEKLKEVKSGT